MSGIYGKQTEAAIAAMSRLAEVYDGGQSRLSATEIADSRGLQRPRVAKALSILSQAGLVVGSPGPGGGFALADDPSRITVHDVFVLFEREADQRTCPFGGGICGVGRTCPFHDQFLAVRSAMDAFLHETTFDRFRDAYQNEGWRPARKGTWGSNTPQRRK